MKQAYHKLCVDCAKSTGKCSKCQKPRDREERYESCRYERGIWIVSDDFAVSGIISEEKDPNVDKQAFEEEIAELRERERRTALRQMQRKKQAAKGTKDDMDEENSGSESDC